MVAVKPLRVRDRMLSRWDTSRSGGGVLCNSFPKSGTHLLLQILRVLPETKFYGSFLASVPSIRFKMRSPSAHLRCIRAMAPREVMPAHLYHCDDHAHQIREQRLSHFFIYRDLRDVVVSESFYLANMARWHRMSRYFQQALDLEAQLLLSIEGMPEKFPNEYPSIAARFGFYQPWLSEENCLAVRFEDLVGPDREQAIREIGEFDQATRGVQYDLDQFVQDARNAIDPKKSHTFRSGKKEEWREHFSPRVSDAFDRVAGELMGQLGYSS